MGFNNNAKITRFSDENDDINDTRIILGITVKPTNTFLKQVGLFVVNLVDFTLKITEVTDNEFFTHLEALILQMVPTTCILVTFNDDVDIKRLAHVLETCNLVPHRHLFIGPNNVLPNNDELRSIGLLESFLVGTDDLRNHLKETSLKLGLRSLLAIVDSFDFLNKNIYKKKFTLEHYPIENYLAMDKAAFNTLSILPRPGCKAGLSLYGVLNKCRTSVGSHMLKMWISQPLTDEVEISNRQDCVEAFKARLYRMIQTECLRRVPDLDSIVVKLRNYELHEGNQRYKSKLTFEDLVNLYDCIVAVNRMVQFVLRPYNGIHSDTVHMVFTEPLTKMSGMLETYLRLIEKTIDLKEAESRNYVINRNFDPTLMELARKLDAIRGDMDSLRMAIEDELKFSTTNRKKNNVKIVECNTMGFLFRVSKRDQMAVQKLELPGIHIEKIRLNKNEFLFTTPKLRKLCSQFNHATVQYNETQSILVNKTFKVASTYWTLIETFLKIVATLDILTAFAEIATTNKYVRASIDESNSEIELIDARHPIIESSLPTQSFVSNNYYLNRETSRVHITTGPNMGGKSTYIKQIALIVVMNQIGSFVPCSEAKLPIFKHVLCRIGASDIQMRGVSTFLLEMIESAAILRTANEKSLVIIDELGRGTSTQDGFGLAWGIMVHLIERAKCFCLCATHFHELGKLADKYKCVANKHLSAEFFDENMAMTFLYKINNGISKRSFGINVARIANFPEEVINNARDRLAEIESLYNCDKIQELFKADTFEEFHKRIPIILNAP